MVFQKTRGRVRLSPRNLHCVDLRHAQQAAGCKPPRAAHQHIAPVFFIFLHDNRLQQSMSCDGLRQYGKRRIFFQPGRNHSPVNIGKAQTHGLYTFFLGFCGLPPAFHKPFPLDLLCQGVYAAGEAFDDDPFRYV